MRISTGHGPWAIGHGQNTHQRKRAAFLLPVLLLTTVSLGAQVSFDRLLQADREPQNWLTYSGTYLGQRYSQLAQITPDNVKALELQWVFQARSTEKYGATALVVDGVMYTVQAPNDIVALDAVTGRTFWQYSYRPAPQSRPCCGRVNRGVAVLGGAEDRLPVLHLPPWPRARGPRHRSGSWRV